MKLFSVTFAPQWSPSRFCIIFPCKSCSSFADQKSFDSFDQNRSIKNRSVLVVQIVQLFLSLFELSFFELFCVCFFVLNKEPSRAKQSQAEPSRAKQSKQSQAEPSRASRAKQSQAEPSRAKQSKQSQAEPSRASKCHVIHK